MTEFDFGTEKATAEALGPMIYEAAQYNCEERRQNSRYSIIGKDSKGKETCYHVIFQRPDRDIEAEEQLDDPSPTGLLSQQMRLTQAAYGQMTAHTKEILTQTRNVMNVQEQTIKAQGKRIGQLERERELLTEILASLREVSSELDEKRRADQRWDRVFEIAETHVVPALKDKILANPDLLKLVENFSPDMVDALRSMAVKEKGALAADGVTPSAAEVAAAIEKPVPTEGA
jgi:hypothetical protein